MPHGLTKRAAYPFEAGFDHVMVIGTGDVYMNRRPEALTEGTKEVRHQLGWEPSHLLAGEMAPKMGVGPSREIECDLRLRLVHRQQESVPRDPELGTERPPQGFAQGECAVLHR